MAISPSTDNYTLGKGIVFFDKKDSITSLYGGERDLGNAPAFTFNIAIEKLEHYSSRGGLKAKDKEIISQITPGVSFTLDEINKENLALLTLAQLNEVSQSAGYVSAEVITAAHLGLRSDLEFRNVGTEFCSTGAFTGGPFTDGEALSLAPSGATAIFCQGTDGTGVWLAVVTGTPASGDTITGDTSSATATMDAAPVWTPGVLLVQDDADTVTFVAGTDYEVSTLLKDDSIGRIKFLSGGTLTEGEEVHVTYGYAVAEYTEVQAFKETQV